MNNKQYLTEYLIHKQNIKYKLYKIEEMRQSADIKAVQYDKEKVCKTNKITDPMAEIDKYLDAENELQEDVKKLAETTKYINSKIQLLEDNMEKEVLFNFFVMDMTIDEIAKKQKRKKQYILKIYESGVENLKL
jgi:hypothetical protein